MEPSYLSWVSVDGAVSYNVYRFTSMITNINGSLTFVTNTKLTSAVDTELTNGTYYYAITAVSASGESTNSNCQYIIIAIPLSNSTSTTTTTTIPNSSTSTSSNNPQINNIEIGLISGGYRRNCGNRGDRILLQIQEKGEQPNFFQSNFFDCGLCERESGISNCQGVNIMIPFMELNSTSGIVQYINSGTTKVKLFYWK